MISSKYLQHYAVQEARFIGELCTKIDGLTDIPTRGDTGTLCWQSCLTIPAFAETFGDLTCVAKAALHQSSAVLQIWVINCPDSGSIENVRQTQQCHHEAVKNSREIGSFENLSLRCFGKNIVLLVDRCTNGRELPVKRGVGLARKIGGDIALALYSSGRLSSAWCGFTDADAILPADYFLRLLSQKKGVAAIYPYFHQPEGGQHHRQVIRQYQMKLDHHVAGLKQAGSPYAFHTIGSTIAVDLNYYEQVRGIPARPAGEDFYFLNKLAKSGTIECLSGEPIVLSGRKSLRVPFGTGPTIARSLQPGAKPLAQYNPWSYRLLEVLLSSVDDFWEESVASQTIKQTKRAEALMVSVAKSLGRLQDNLKTVLRQSAFAFEEDIASKCMGHFQMRQSLHGMISQSTSKQIFCRHFHCWFDGFRTLKFIHWWRDHGLADCPVYEQ